MVKLIIYIAKLSIMKMNINQKTTLLIFAVMLLVYGIQGIGYADNTGDPHWHDDSTTRSIAENSSTGTNVGAAVTAHDFIAGALSHRYILDGTDKASFNISDSTGQITSNTTLDYETKDEYTVTVKAQAWKLADGLWEDKDSITVIINVTNVNEAPTFPDTTDTTLEVTKYTLVGTNIGAPISATDEDGDTLTYTLGGTDAASFDFETATGQLKTLEGVTFDRTTQPSYMVTVTASDSEFMVSTSVVITVVVTPVCDRTPAVRDAIVAEVPGVTDCADVTETHLAAITSLNLAYKGITALKAGDFDGLTALTELDLNNNQIRRLPSGVFDQLTALTTLRLNDNQLRMLEEDVFDGLTALTTLTLSNNQLRMLDEDVFDGLTALTELRLSGNQLRMLAEDVFDGLTALTTLTLSGNQLSTLEEDVFDGLTALTTLLLDENRLISLEEDVFDGLTALATLRLTKNKISPLPAGVFDGLTALTTLYLDGADLTALPEEVFEGLTALTTLTLDGNDLTALPEEVFEGLTALTTLTLPRNDITALPADVFEGLTTLSVLRLNQNKLSTLPAGVFEGLTALTRLYLNNNTVNPLPLTVSLKQVAEGEFKATAHTGAPFGMVLPVTVTNGTIDGGATMITVPIGNVESGSLTVTRTTGTTAAVTVTIGTLPGLPSDHTGYALSKSSDLPLKVISNTSNNAPEFTDGTETTRLVGENTAAGENIGDPVAATDDDTTDTLTYRLNGTDADSFDIVSTTGQLQTKAALDRETKSSYSVTVVVTDGNGGIDSIAVTITVTEANYAPEFTDGDSTTRSVAENTEANINIGAAVTATDPNVAGTNTDVNPETSTPDTLTYTLSGTTDQPNDYQTFDIDTATGQLKTKDPLDYETKTSYKMTVSVSDGTLSDTITVTINITNVNEAPTFPATTATTLEIAENTAANTNIGDPVTATDPDSGDTLTYSLDATGDTTFDIDSSTGQLKTSAALDFETKNSYTVTVTATDSSSLTATIEVTINITNVNEAPTFPATTDTTLEIAENTAAGTAIGAAVSATDPDVAGTNTDVNPDDATVDALTYTLGGTDAASFDIVSTSGQLQAKAALDYETKNSYEVTVTASDGGTDTASVTVTISVTNVNEAPTFPSTTDTRSVAENTAAGTNIGAAVTATDPDVAGTNTDVNPDDATVDALTYTLGGTDAASFDIVSTSGQLQTKTALDYETDNSYEVTVTASDGGTDTASVTVTINVTNVNEAPTFPATTDTRSIAENTGAGTDIGVAVSATDPDVAGTNTDVNPDDANVDALTYTLGGTDAASFDIVSTSGQLQTKAALDYETDNSYTVTVSVSDGADTDSITVTISVTNVNEAPTFPATTDTRSIAENTGAGTDIGAAVTATDPDVAGTNTDVNPDDATVDALTYTLGGTDAASFDIVSTSGQLQTKAALDYETRDSYEVTVTASDGGTDTASVTVTISVTDVDETGTNNAPEFTDGTETTTRSVAENTAAGEDIGSAVEATDDDSGDTLTYTLGGTDAASFDIVGTSGQLQTKSALDYEATKNSYSVTVSVSDGNSGSDSIDVTINVTNINEAPTFPATTDTTLEVTKHTPEGTDIGDPVAATDPDGDTDVNPTDATVDALTYTLGGADAASFDIDSDTGQLKTKTGVAFDRTTQSSYMVTVTASDGEFMASTSVGITVVVTPVCDRTAAVRDAIVAAVPGVTDCADVTETHLAAITGPLNLANKSITALKAGDFDGLTALTELDLNNNKIRTLPSGVFGELTALTTLYLNINRIRTLPAGVFDEITALTTLSLANNQIITLPADVFDQLTALTTLSLNDNQLTTLPAGVFDQLTALTTLRLNDNQLTTLPAGVFDQLTALTTLRLSGNQLITLDENVFDGLTALTGLFLTGNQLITLEEDVFDGLTALTTLLLDENQLINLKEDVFDGLTALATLRLTNNKISTLPADVFEGLTALTTLTLDDNDITALPADVFKGLTALTTLTLDDNDITALPADVFEGLTALTTLTLPRNDITALPADVFEGLTTLSVLRLNHNKLSTLPAGVFEGLTALTTLYLNNNVVNPLPLTVSLKQVAEGEFKATAHTGAPFAVVLPVTVTDGTLDGTIATITVPIGNVESGSRTVTRTTGTTAAVTVTIGTLPGLPTNHTGYALTKSSDLPLKVISEPSNNAPEFTDGTETTRSVAENAAAGQNIGSAVAATDDDAADTLTYRLNGTDADSFDIVSTSGQLKTKAVFDRETKSSYSVTVVVTDGNGGIDSIAVTITVTEPNNAPEFTDGDNTTREVDENTATGENIGDPVAATDDDISDTLTYTFSGTDAASFAIVSSSGQLQTNAALDYETDNSYSVTVSVSDGIGGSDSIDVTINITNVNEAPTFPATTDTTLEVTKHTPVGTDIGDPVAATDPDVTSTNTDVNPTDANVDALTYTLGGTDAASFDIDSDTGQLKTKTGVTFDRTTQSSYMVTVTASDGEFMDSTSVGITVVVTPVCDRTPAVRDAIVAEVPGVTDCADVTETHLAAIMNLNLSNKSITALKAGDFDGLTALETLNLSRNQISTLPARVFDELTALTELDLYDNQISILPAGVFDEITALTELSLNNNQISTLPAGVFDELTALTELYLSYNQISTLTAGVFDKLTALTALYLHQNQISTLTAGVFDGLTALTTLTLYSNQISTLTAGVFDELTALTRLDLDNNQISTLPAGVFDKLTALTRLYLHVNQISTLPAGVFDELTALTTLTLYSNQISTLPAGVFDELTALTTLSLSRNQISTLPAGVFDKLTALTTLYLHTNQISTLTEEVFDGLTALTALYLHTNQISTLPEEVFDGLTALTALYLHNNQISTLPAGVFEGLTALTTLNLNNNMVNPLPLTVSLKQVAEGEFKATAYTGAPFEMVLPVTVTNGSIDGTATTITIPIGSVESESLTVTRTTGTTAAVTVNIGTLPGLPSNHQGYALTKSSDLPLTVISNTSNNAPEFTDGTETTRSVAENTAAGENIGDPVAATDDDTTDTLTYRLNGTDADSFDIVSTTGQLKTKAALDYATKNSYSVTVIVTDGNGGINSIAVTISVTEPNNAPEFTDGTETTTRSVAENTAAGEDIGSAVEATDDDSGDTLTYTLGGTDAASFDIVSSSGQLKTKDALDYEGTKNSYSVTVSVSDGTDTDSIDVTINVTNVNEAPTFPGTTATRSVAENKATGTAIGAAVTATDPDVAGTNTDVNPDDATVDALTYTLGGTDAASFDIVSTSGQLQTKAALDYETDNSYSVTVTVSDGGTDTASVTVTINVTNVNEAPTFPATTATRSVAENTEAGINIGAAVAATDPDVAGTNTDVNPDDANVDALTYTLGGTDAASFDIVSTSGQLQTKAALDHETKASYSVTVTVSDGGTDTASVTVTISVTDVDETRPTVSITVPSGVQKGAFDVTVVFSKAVTGFVQSELVVTGISGASITAWNPQTGSTDYKVTITPTSSGTAIFNVAANVAKDTADNQNTAATQQTVQVNLTRPTVIINVPSGVQNGVFDVTVAFNEVVTGFVQSELVVSGTSGASITAWNPQTGGTDYKATITPTQTGEAIFNVAANVAVDSGSNQNTAATQQTVQVDMTQPTVSITVPSGVQNSAFDVTVIFSEAVTGFVQSELVVTGTSGASITAWNPQTGGTDYKATITPTSSGTAIFNVAANVAVDSGSNQNTAATQQTVQVDMTSPTVSITVPSGVQNGAFDVTVVFSEAVTGFVQSELVVTGTSGASITAWNPQTGGTDYKATITPTSSGTAIFNVAANVAVDSGSNQNTAAIQQTVAIDLTQVVPNVPDTDTRPEPLMVAM